MVAYSLLDMNVLNSKSTWALVISIIALVLGLILYFTLDWFIAQIIYQKLTLLDSNSELYEKWTQLPVPINLQVWIFEETNPEGIWKGEKPSLREKGPYVFSLYKQKRVSDKNILSLTYSEHRIYKFDVDKSIGSLEDKIFVLNVPTVAIAEKLGSISDKLPLKLITGLSLELIGNALFEAHKEELLTEMTVDELLFKGQKVKILETFNRIWAPLEVLGVAFPETGLKDNTYGLFYGQNSTFSDSIEIIGQGQHMGMTVAWKGQRKLDIWPGEACNKILGSDGGLFSPFVDRNKPLFIFVPDLCRYISFTFEKSIIFRGIPGYRFILSNFTFASKYRSKESSCFCPREGFPCNMDGLADLGPCRAGAPIFLSSPHFLAASDSFTEAIDGISANTSLHQSFIDIEPTSGTPIRARIRFQINVFVRRFPFIKTMSDIRKETIYPLAWFQQSGEISEELASELKAKLIKPLSYANIFRTVFLVLAVSLFWICLIWKFQTRKKCGLSNKHLRKPNLARSRKNSEFIPDIVTDPRIEPASLQARRISDISKLYDSSLRKVSPKTNKVANLEPYVLHRNNYT